MAYYPDKFVFAQKGTISSGPARGLNYLKHVLFRPAMIFSSVTVTYAATESFFSEVRGTNPKDAWDSTLAGAAAGMVLGGFLTRRFDIATTTSIGTALMMGLLEFTGSSMICDASGKESRSFPTKVPTAFEESGELQDLKEKYPAYKTN